MGSSESGKRCMRCGTEAAVHHDAPAIPFEEISTERLWKGCPVDLDDPTLVADLRAANRIVRSVQGRATRIDLPEIPEPIAEPVLRAAPPSPLVAPAAAIPPAPRTRRARETEKPKSAGSSWAWGILSLSLAALVCGGILLGWSHVGKRPELWNIGLPFALVGQAGLILGLILQLDGLWQSNTEAAAAVDELDDHVSELRHATTMLTTSHSGPSQAFYNHFADGAKPDLLLADLKGQLDLLASRLAATRE